MKKCEHVTSSSSSECNLLFLIISGTSAQCVCIHRLNTLILYVNTSVLVSLKDLWASCGQRQEGTLLYQLGVIYLSSFINHLFWITLAQMISFIIWFFCSKTQKFSTLKETINPHIEEAGATQPLIFRLDKLLKWFTYYQNCCWATSQLRD